ncbi:MAG TPA: twin-arginine translocase TatA/TatE family subunit [Candidatus Limnocylindrales bacterium]|nr:twin-arginine translocase TatA/TatE family subunit [Candidatus Limnocylindrales bacterium]
MPFNIGPGELILILVIALVVLGPGKLPDVAQSLGKSLREFRKAATDVQDAAKIDAPVAPAAPAAPAAPITPVAPAPTAAAAPNTLSGASEPNTLSADGDAQAAPVAAGTSSAPDSNQD